jgi:hypothetical protein
VSRGLKVDSGKLKVEFPGELDVSGYGEECGRNLSAGKAVVDCSEETLEFCPVQVVVGAVCVAVGPRFEKLES